MNDLYIQEVREMEIIICNLRNTRPQYPWDFRVDRVSPLGNPYKMPDERYRKQVCVSYEEYFNGQLREYNRTHIKNDFIVELLKIKKAYFQYGKLRLFCWCAPKQCHAETIQNYFLTHFNK